MKPWDLIKNKIDNKVTSDVYKRQRKKNEESFLKAMKSLLPMFL